MPEGHTLHRLARDQQPMVGHVAEVSSPQGRFSDAGRVSGHVVTSVDAFGKHLFTSFDNDETVHVHLGMQGRFFPVKDPSLAARPQVRMRLSTAPATWDLVAPSKCEVLSDAAARSLQASLGPDPLRPDAGVELAWEHVRSYDGPIAVALLDQSVIAGVGNVFRSEALAAVGVHPASACRAIDESTFAKLWSTLLTMMRQAVEDGRIITMDVPSEERANVPEGEARYVYKQSVCRRTGTSVETLEVGGRTAYVCPVCQPLS